MQRFAFSKSSIHAHLHDGTCTLNRAVKQQVQVVWCAQAGGDTALWM